MGAGDLAGDLGQGTIPSSLELETVVDNNDGMGSAAPFPNEARAGFQGRLGLPRI